ncbi:cell division protein ZapA [Inquilinus sp. NPDC058860]|uniref:cell division protein ZapA n=1 Tax=unclassified Inquilinus TaxID=2645927 RepID=UPI001CE47C6B|nr:cell division protein ZapA [Inquilinus sp. Marseille-Q2685]
MARVEITLNNRPYPIACEDGQEGRVREVAAFVAERIREIQGSVRTATDTHLLVMVALMLGDELLDLREGKVPGAPAPAPSPLDDPELASRLQKLADRIEAIAARVETP